MRFEALKVGELAKRTGLTVRALHHYDEIGLLKPSLHTEAGYRLYTADDVARLQRVLSLRQLGFSLEQVRDCLDALAKSDALLARVVIAGDRRVDCRYRAVLADLKNEIRRDPERLNTWLRLMNTARNLERIADHATSIAEAVVYLKEGDIVRHVFSTE